MITINKDGSITTKLSHLTIDFKGFNSNPNVWTPDSIRVHCNSWSLNIAFFPSRTTIYRSIDSLDIVTHGPSININFINQPNISYLDVTIPELDKEEYEFKQLFKV